MFLKTQNKINFLLKVEQQAWACMYVVYFKETFFNLFQTILKIVAAHYSFNMK